MEIWLGYDNNLIKEFSGYISKVPAGIPLTIELEDEMYQLKRQYVTMSMSNGTLREVLEKIAPGYEIVCDETKLTGSVSFKQKTAAQCLDELKSKGIHCFFVGKTLHAMDAYSREDSKEVDIVLEHTAGKSLRQKPIENVTVIIEKLKLRGKPITVKYGDGSGTIIRRKYSIDERITEAVMEAEAKMIYDRAKLPGMDGDVTLFGTPSVHHGYKMNLQSKIYDERNGVYYIDSVTKTFKPSSYRQICTLGVET